MKYAILSDIHGNLPALEKVLKDAKNRGIENYIITGDYCLSGPYPNDCINVLKDIKNKHIIRGNEEIYLERLVGQNQSDWTDGQMQISYWCYRNIQKANLDYLIGLPRSLDFTCNDINIHINHFSEALIGKYEFGKVDSLTLADSIQHNLTFNELNALIDDTILADSDLQDLINKIEPGVYIFGHSHVQWKYVNNEKGIYLINPGSCGLPLDLVKDSIPYCILTIEENGEIDVEQVRLSFDKNEYVSMLMETTQYSEANVWSKVIIAELLTSRECINFFLQFVEEYANSLGDDRRPYAVDLWEEAYVKWCERQRF